MTNEHTPDTLQHLLNDYCSWAVGECFGYILEDANGNQLISCYGYIGQYEYCLGAARDADKRMQARVNATRAHCTEAIGA